MTRAFQPVVVHHHALESPSRIFRDAVSFTKHDERLYDSGCQFSAFTLAFAEVAGILLKTDLRCRRLFQKKFRVLLIEDNPGDVFLLREMLDAERKRRFYISHVAASVAEH